VSKQKEEEGLEFNITLTNKQAGIVQCALNFYGRSFLGQMDLWHLGMGVFESNVVEEALKKEYFKDSNLADHRGASYGIYSKEISDDAREAIDIHDVIRHQFWLDRPEADRTRYTVDSYPPTNYSEKKLPVIHREST